MGSWFSNIHIRKNEMITEETVADYINKVMAAQQYLPVASGTDADGTVAIVANGDCQWVSVFSDLISHDDPESCARIAAPISAELHTDVLGISCFDSDYLYLNLINTEEKTDAWIGIGSASELGIKRRSGLAAWKKKVSDFPAFSEGIKKNYVLAEEFLTVIEPCLKLPAMQSSASYEYLKEFGLDKNAKYLYFKRRDDAPSKESAQLVLYYMYYGLPCFVEKPNSVMAINTGAESRGLSVYFLGPYVETDEITFSDVHLETWKESIPIELTKVQLPDGQWAYCYHDPDFQIPPKVPNRVAKEKRALMEKERHITVRFVPHGNPRKTLDITVALVPDKNQSGQAKWNVWHPWGSKKAFIEHHNKIWKRVRAFETNPDSCLPLLSEKDFD